MSLVTKLLAPDATTPLNLAEQSLLRELVLEFGEALVLAELELGRHTLPRVIAGLDLRKGTIVLVRARLPRLRERLAARARTVGRRRA